MANDEALDHKYFLDEYTYNCPFCNRGSVTYRVSDRFQFNWSEDRVVNGYIVTCESCDGSSLHLSNYYFSNYGHTFGNTPTLKGTPVTDYDKNNLDQYFFYHQPTSFFVLNTHIHKEIRLLISEAEGCKKMDFMVGASGALRKAIYEFLQNQKAEGASYEDKIKFLKSKYPRIDGEYFDALSNIQDMTSESLHEKEGSWKPWSAADFDYLLEVTRTILDEVYVKPKERGATLTRVLELKQKAKTFSTPVAIKEVTSASGQPVS